MATKVRIVKTTRKEEEVCEICEKSFSNKWNLKRHIESAHADVHEIEQAYKIEANEVDDIKQMFRDGKISFDQYQHLTGLSKTPQPPLFNLGRLMATGEHGEGSYAVEYYEEFCAEFEKKYKTSLLPIVKNNNFDLILKMIIRPSLKYEGENVYYQGDGKVEKSLLTIRFCKRLYCAIIQSVYWCEQTAYQHSYKSGTIDDTSQGVWCSRLGDISQTMLRSCNDKVTPAKLKLGIENTCNLNLML